MARLEVELVYALPEQQTVLRLTVAEGCTAAQAIALTHLAVLWQPPGSEPLALARYGRLITADTVLASGDRIEILRPLTADPKDQRRQRVKTAARAKRANAQL